MFRRRRTRPERDEAERHSREQLAEARKANEYARQNRNFQALAIIVAIAGIIATVLLVWQPWSESSAPHARIALFSATQNAVIPRDILQIPSPPAYPGGERSNHCGAWWRNWFAYESAAPVPTNFYIEISAPTSADATVTAASVHVFRSYVPRAMSFILCNTGAGLVSGTILNVNLARPYEKATIVSDIGEAVPLLSMPDAVINIDPGHTEDINITPRGDDRFYQWSLSLTIVIDQHSQSFTIGSAEHPLCSWFGITPSLAYDYFQKSHSWRALEHN
jgi:hypothetical protein